MCQYSLVHGGRECIVSRTFHLMTSQQRGKGKLGVSYLAFMGVPPPRTCLHSAPPTIDATFSQSALQSWVSVFIAWTFYHHSKCALQHWEMCCFIQRKIQNNNLFPFGQNTHSFAKVLQTNHLFSVVHNYIPCCEACVEKCRALNKHEGAWLLLLLRVAIFLIDATLVAFSSSSKIISQKLLWIFQYSEPDHQESKNIVMPIFILKVEWAG